MPLLNPASPTLYLDFDGVLHPDAVYLHQGRGLVLHADGHTLLEAAGILEELLLPYPDTQIVLATSWVRVIGFVESRERLPIGLHSRVVAATWRAELNQFEWAHMPRYLQIEQHVDANRIQEWLALDDDAMGWPIDQSHRLVQTSPERGLLESKSQIELAQKLKELNTW